MLIPAARKSSCVSTALPAETMAMNHHLFSTLDIDAS
jgi:hypothetical protein